MLLSAKPHKQELAPLLPELIDWLCRHDCEPLLDLEGGQYTTAAPAVERAKLPDWKPQLVIVLGGDGTLLSVARDVCHHRHAHPQRESGFSRFPDRSPPRRPLRHAGGLAHGLPCLIDARSLLHADLWREGKLQSSFRALNEVVASKGDIARMGDFVVELNGKLVARFRADGVIVSTPTGSTAYTLAANGPILTPDVDALVVTPICPHLLTLRPIVVRGDAKLTVRIEGISKLALLTVDGQTAVELHLGDEVRCRRSSHTVNLVRLSESGFFEALRSKLSWGER